MDIIFTTIFVLAFILICVWLNDMQNTNNIRHEPYTAWDPLIQTDPLFSLNKNQYLIDTNDSSITPGAKGHDILHTIPICVINLEQRTDRLGEILNELKKNRY